ncbi:ATP-binding cassette domain-containing protein [Candidatus Nephthysia bennettiae]|uniref:ABC transporter ATP-binding protein n=1 Tax=Candidatus Nephthysia bennettiae TaxID=3127016 RepID=A0A934N7I0_9BACT|nr:ABC transporter ATP-binding protein [Candidatus Dormibacteraeota bacterium]MBJ7614220.1 ABC transporter ATP-binding protein [Candidatus Dormibacteraeota bacterium]
MTGAVRAEVVSARGLAKRFAAPWGSRSGGIAAVDGVDLAVVRGETLGLVGESGSGKSTLGRMLLRLLEPDRGDIVFEGRPLTGLPNRQLRRLRPRMQIVFQNPYSALNPRMRVQEIIAFNLRAARVSRSDRRERVAEVLRLVSLERGILGRYPHQLSGGQAQRVGIARALVSAPAFLVADEPVSALDLSVQAEILNLFGDLQESLELACLFISHNLQVVRHVAHRVAVMYAGRIVELGRREAIYEEPQHPYTRLLLSAIPTGARSTDVLAARAHRQRLRDELRALPKDAPLREVFPGHFVALQPAQGSLGDRDGAAPFAGNVGGRHGG